MYAYDTTSFMGHKSCTFIYLFLGVVYVKAFTSHKHINFNEAACQTKWNPSLHGLRDFN